jgi:hypothetical protein
MLALILIAATAGDALSDLRTTLAQLAGTTPAHGTFDVTSTETTSDEPQPFEGKASVGFEVDSAGLRILYPRATLAQATQEARAEAVDPNRQTPARSGVQRIHALDLAELLDAASALSVKLQNAQLVDSRSAPYRGKPARLVALKLTPKMSKGESKHVKKLEGTLSVWLGDDGVPIAAEQSFYAKASFLLMSFESTQKENWTFTRAGDRLVATHHERTENAGGFGEHTASRIEQNVRLEP